MEVESHGRLSSGECRRLQIDGGAKSIVITNSVVAAKTPGSMVRSMAARVLPKPLADEVGPSLFGHLCGFCILDLTPNRTTFY